MKTYRTQHFFLVLWILISLLLVLRGLYFYKLTEYDIRRIVHAGVRNVLVEAADRIREELSRESGRMSLIRNYITRVETNNDLIRTLSFVMDGKVVFSSDPHRVGKAPRAGEARPVLATKVDEILDHRSYYLREFFFKDGRRNRFDVVAEVSSEYIDRIFYDKIKRFFLLSVLVPILLVASIWWLVRSYIVRPLEELQQMAAERKSRFEARYFLKELDDLGKTLARTFGKIREQLNALDYMAMYDKLTHLPNRNYMQNRIDKMIEEAEGSGGRFSLVFLDLDNFKQINDTEGHDVGDRILHEVGLRLKALLEKGETVGRIGGDEFMWLTPLWEREKLKERLRAIISAINEPVRYDAREFRIGVSCGVATFPDDGNNRIALSKNADIALYEAKKLGRNRFVFFDEELARVLIEASKLEREMEHALSRGEFVVYYQPKVCIRTGKVTGAEALLRWIHPEHGVVSPELFIPIAERSGFILKLGRFVTQKACETAGLLKERGLNLHVAVNLSAVQVRPELIEEIDAIVGSCGIEKERVRFEITETVLMENFEVGVETLNSLADAGYWICLDDFGTGYSSLAYLRMMPVRSLKIDKSFIMQLDTYEHSRALVEGIVALGHALELSVVAEGVEEPAILNFLRDVGCDSYQGYLFSPPRPLEEFLRLLG